jgi:hypothetical protein
MSPGQPETCPGQAPAATAPVDHLAGQEKADPAGGQRRGSRPPGSEVQTGVALGLSGSGTPAATQITLFWRSVGGFGSEQVAAHIGGSRAVTQLIRQRRSVTGGVAALCRPAAGVCR